MTVELSNTSSPFVLTAPHTVDVEARMLTLCDKRGFHHDFLSSDQPALREAQRLLRLPLTTTNRAPSSWINLLGNRRLHGGRRSSECESGRNGSRSLDGCQGAYFVRTRCELTCAFAKVEATPCLRSGQRMQF